MQRLRGLFCKDDPQSPREPCPDRILDGVGGAFSVGVVGGSAYHFILGMYASPDGARLLGGSQAIRLNAPRVGGSFAVFGGLYSAFNCSMVYVRQKEDYWNSIIAGAATGGFLTIRRGLHASARAAALSGALLALVEGNRIMFHSHISEDNIQTSTVFIEVDDEP